MMTQRVATVTALAAVVALAVLSGCDRKSKPAAPTMQAVDTPFIAREDASSIRVLNFNINSVYPDEKYLESDKFTRILAATAPDIITLQEVHTDYDAPLLAARFAEAVPLPQGQRWHVYISETSNSGNVIAARWPLGVSGDVTEPPAFPPELDRSARIAYALVNLPDDEYPADLLLINVHFKCCGGTENDPIRQQEADAVANWLRDARTPGDHIDVPLGTGLLVVGDLNTVGGPQIVETIVTGDVQDDDRFGPDAHPDWDGTGLTDAKPPHNGIGDTYYTWRNDTSEYPPGRLDYIIFSDSVLSVTHEYVLNTTTMAPELLSKFGLSKFDVTEDQVGAKFDHLPLVVDFELHPLNAE